MRSCKQGMLCLAALVLLSGALPAHAREQPAQDAGIAMVSGGIGEASRTQLLADEGRYNLKLVFTLVEGNYIAGVTLSIVDARGGTVLRHVADGPIALARLPRGDYVVNADYEGQSQVRKVRIGARMRTEYLRWPGNPATDFPLPPEHREPH